MGQKIKKSPGQKNLVKSNKSAKKFREIAFLISRVFLAWTFFNFLAHCETIGKYTARCRKYNFFPIQTLDNLSQSRLILCDRTPTLARQYMFTSRYYFYREGKRGRERVVVVGE